jgi:hypothetical protein
MSPMWFVWVAKVFGWRIDCSVGIAGCFCVCQCCDEGDMLDGCSEEFAEPGNKTVWKMIGKDKVNQVHGDCVQFVQSII